VSVRSDVLLWAQRVMTLKGGAAHKLLEIKEHATLDQAQDAFHKIARTAHPDLHRQELDEKELELVTSAYATVAGAYQEFKFYKEVSDKNKSMKTPPTGISARVAATQAAGGAVPVTPSGTAPVAGAAQSMTSRALVYYRKAELSLRRGDLKGALVQLKMAIAADPQSGLLRTALAEVELETRKGT
jgi:hypothetical protein